MYKETGSLKAVKRALSVLLVGLLSCLMLTGCSHEEIYGRLVDKQSFTNMMMINSGSGVMVPHFTYSYRVEVESSQDELQHLYVDVSDYEKCSVGDYFYQDVEGEVTCSPDSFR